MVEGSIHADLAERPVATGLKPPPFGKLAFAWLRRRAFAGPAHALISLVVLYLVAEIAWHLVPWALFNATWTGAQRADCAAGGACWAFVTSRFGQFIYGFYPEAERWRVDLAMLLLAAGVAALLVRSVPGKRLTAALMLIVYPVLGFWLLHGGMGLKIVETEKWGGLTLTLVVGVTGLVASFPIGIVLALGRQSALPVIRIVSTTFIEVWRGVPLITVLFMALVMLPLFLPMGLRLNELALALTGIVIFSGAYLAEVVRGGLQAIPEGQYEAARALGLGYWKTTLLVILPQALEKVVPAIVNYAIALFKDTTLVMIVGLFDLLNIVSAGAADPRWLGSSAEGYVFVALVFWIFCFGFSRYSQRVEHRLKQGRAC